MEKNTEFAKCITALPKSVLSASSRIVCVVAVLLLGWSIFPSHGHSKTTPLFFFSHEIHTSQDKVAAACLDCHSFKKDGTFTGFPALESCEGCHEEIMTTEPGKKATAAEKAAYAAEKQFIDQYVSKGKEVPWASRQKLPASVTFSHNDHYAECYGCHLTMQGQFNLGTADAPEKLCNKCHPSIKELDSKKALKKPKFTALNKKTGKMKECDVCHANPGHAVYFEKGRPKKAQ